MEEDPPTSNNHEETTTKTTTTMGMLGTTGTGPGSHENGGDATDNASNHENDGDDRQRSNNERRGQPDEGNEDAGTKSGSNQQTTGRERTAGTGRRDWATSRMKWTQNDDALFLNFFSFK
jgi:hypothetical protein